MTRPGFTICICPDARLTRDRIDALLAAHPPAAGNDSATSAGLGGLVPSASATWDRQAFWGDEPLPPAFWEHLTLQGLFATPHALVVRNAQNLPAETWKRISAALAKPNPLAWPFLCLEVPFDKGQPKVPAHIARLRCLDFAEKQKWIWRSPGLDERGVATFVRQHAASRAIRFAPGALEAVCAALPPDATAIATELEKLSLAAGDGEVTAAMAALVDHAADIDIFAFMRALQAGNAPMTVWRQVLRDRLGGDSMLFPFLGMLLRETRILWQLLAGEPVRLPPSVLPPKQQLARQLGHAGLARIWDLALEAELGIKSGERSPEQAMEVLVAGLFTLFARSRRAATGTGQSGGGHAGAGQAGRPRPPAYAPGGQRN
ncbi:DNA polymerase III subunit delta [Nitratidesulfovibrio termitidis]|uniref:DNA polymerase III subunit delta n=1 Tax=Nitratidesulfovibrio termitidis TaxID=42252 RepID=UPI000413FF3C|nr:DNA polymerase III subunit delta [Nitratidesulfovibrio termitidis]